MTPERDLPTPERIEQMRGHVEHFRKRGIQSTAEQYLVQMFAAYDALKTDAALGAGVRELARSGICEYVALADCGDTSFVAVGVDGFNDVPVEAFESAPTLDAAVAKARAELGAKENGDGE